MKALSFSLRSLLKVVSRASRRPGSARRRRADLRLEPLEDRTLLAVYYLSPSGNDRNNGLSTSRPWKTIAKVNQVTFRPGDTILFQGGATFNGTLRFDAADAGTPMAPVTVSSYGTGRATINGGKGDGIHVYNAGGFVVSNLNFRGNGYANGNRGKGIVFYTDQVGQRNFVRIDQVQVTGFEVGILVLSWRTDNQVSGYNDVRVTHAVVHDVQSYGIMFWTPMFYGSQNVYVGYSKVYNIPGHTGLAAAGITLQNLSNGLVEWSVAHNVGANSDLGPAGFSVLDSSNVTLQYLESYRNRKPAGRPDGDGIDIDGGSTNILVQYCYLHDNDGPGITLTQYAGGLGTLSNVVVRYNILENNGRSGQGEGGIQIWGASPAYQVRDSHIYNNTIYTGDAPNPRQHGLLAIGSYSNITVRNNIFVNKGGYQIGAYDSPGGLVLQGNAYWSIGGPIAIYFYGANYFSLSAFRSGTGQERLNGTPIGYEGDPQLNNPGGGGALGDASLLPTLTAYQLRSTSPLINAGLNLLSTFGIHPGPTDFYGVSIPQYGAFDIGAGEYSGALSSASASWADLTAADITTEQPAFRRRRYAFI